MPTTTTAAGSLEYKNDFFSIRIREVEDRPGSYLFCCGLSLPKFDPIIWGRTGICSNAAFKGLQQLRADVSLFAIKRGIVTKNAESPCGPEGGREDGWYEENSLLIVGASREAVREILEFSAHNLVRTVLYACRPDVAFPAGAMTPESMQRFLESLCVADYMKAAPPPIVKPQAA